MIIGLLFSPPHKLVAVVMITPGRDKRPEKAPAKTVRVIFKLAFYGRTVYVRFLSGCSNIFYYIYVDIIFSTNQ